MELVIYNKVINAPIPEILNQIKKETGKNIFKDILYKKDNYLITCPNHKDGQENHPSCNIYCGKDPNIEYGFAHCFTCDYKAPLYKLVADCFEESEEFGKEWLCDRYGDTFVEEQLVLPKIELNQEKQPSKYLDPSILNNYNYYHPYMWKRKLSKEVVDKFNIGYDPETKCITFPVYDINNNLVLMTKRSVETKHFYISKNLEKPVYLLNEVINKNYPFIVVTESQIDALTSFSYGVPAIALIGLGSKEQYEILNKSPLRNYVLMFDADKWGRKGAYRFKQNIRKDVFITDICINNGKKDINGLSKEEFDSILNSYGLTWRLNS